MIQCKRGFVAGILFFAVALAPVAARADPVEDGLGAEQGDATAQNNLSIRLAAEQGSAVAQNTLGFMYQHGRGAPLNVAEALKWYRLAAEQGFGLALFNLGGLYATGQGVPLDYVQAHMWFSLAATHLPPSEVYNKVAKRRDLVARLMTRAQVAEAQKLAREWRPKGA